MTHLYFTVYWQGSTTGPTQIVVINTIKNRLLLLVKKRPIEYKKSPFLVEPLRGAVG